MTDRVITLYVALEHEMRVDDVEEITRAIRMVKGVADVAVRPRSPDDMVRMCAAGTRLRVALIDLIDAEFSKRAPK